MDIGGENGGRAKRGKKGDRGIGLGHDSPDGDWSYHNILRILQGFGYGAVDRNVDGPLKKGVPLLVENLGWVF